MAKIVAGCYICKHSMWDSEGCFCRLNGAHALAPIIGCEHQEVEQETDTNSSYPEAKAIKNSELSNQLDSLEQRVDELSEEYDAVLKTHGDTFEEHMERITINEGNIDTLCCEMEDLQRKVYQIYQFLDSVDPDFFAKIKDEMVHNGPYFCGNCTHCDHGKQGDDTVYVCDLSAEIIDPDDSSCSMFEPPF